MIARVTTDSRWIQACRWALTITAACLPLYVVRWHYGPLPTTLLETLIVVTVVTYVIGRWRERALRPVRTFLDIPLLLLLLAAAISVVVAKDHRTALGLFRAYFLEPAALFYVATDLVRRDGDYRRLIAALGVGSSIFAVLNIFAFAQALVHHAVHVGVPPSALYGDANYVAMYFDPIVALAAGVVLFGNTPRSRWLGAAWLLLAGTALLLTLSKGSYLGLFGLALFVYATVGRWRVPIIAGVIVAALALSRVPFIADRLATTYNSIAGRAEVFTATYAMIRNSPIFGLGLGGFSYQFRGAIPEVYPHDVWLTFWVETGVLGMIAFGVILFTLLWRGWRAWPRTADFARAALWGVVGGLVVWAMHGLVDSPYWKNDMSALFWIMAAMEVAVLRGLVAVAGRGSPERA